MTDLIAVFAVSVISFVVTFSVVDRESRKYWRRVEGERRARLDRTRQIPGMEWLR